jgi:hypothetical protein
MRIRGYWGEHDAPYLRARLICSSRKERVVRLTN